MEEAASVRYPFLHVLGEAASVRYPLDDLQMIGRSATTCIAESCSLHTAGGLLSQWHVVFAAAVSKMIFEIKRINF